MIIGIHQPNFCPWEGYFEKMAKCDIFVIMTECQFFKGGYQNRFNSDGWNTMSVNSGLLPLREKKYINHLKDWDKITKKFNSLQFFDDCISDDLVSTNIAIIISAAYKLGISTKIEIDEPTTKKGTDRLIDICLKHNATAYIGGESSDKYIDNSKFAENDISFVPHKNTKTHSLWQLI
jgi:hypothetical protein